MQLHKTTVGCMTINESSMTYICNGAGSKVDKIWHPGTVWHFQSQPALRISRIAQSSSTYRGRITHFHSKRNFRVSPSWCAFFSGYRFEYCSGEKAKDIIRRSWTTSGKLRRILSVASQLLVSVSLDEFTYPAA